MAKYTKGAAQLQLVLQFLMVVCCIWWLLYWVLEPITPGSTWLAKIDRRIAATFIGTEIRNVDDSEESGIVARGSVFALQVMPAVAIAFLAYFSIEIGKRIKPSAESQDPKRRPKLNIWTVPIFIRSPFGMLNLGDIIFILVVTFVTFWYLIKSSVGFWFKFDDHVREEGSPSNWSVIVGVFGIYLGLTALIPFALLWIPVSRGSPLLRVIGVPFEHAVKHHVWLGSLCVWLVTGHGAVLTWYYVHLHIGHELLTWPSRETAYLSGILAMVCGILMLATALNVIRRRFFDLFFRVHQLYTLFLLFFAFHAVYKMYILIIPVLLFFLDRYFRAVQSRKKVDVLSAKVLPSGVLELRFAKPRSLNYNSLSFVYMLLPSVSKLEWHPFSVASSPLDNTNEISVYIKPLGGFTKNLHDALISSKHDQNTSYDGHRPVFKCPFSFKLAIEGFYGDESNFYLKYQSLVMVAGGIGVTPFLAVLRDILHRYEMGEKNLPNSIDLIFMCRTVHELHILDTLAPNTILPGYEEHLNIKVHAYLTEKPAPEGAAEFDNVDNEGTELTAVRTASLIHVDDPKSKLVETPRALREMSPIISTGNTAWACATLLATLVGYLIFWGICNETFVNFNSHNYAVALAYILAIFISVVICGGGVMLLWAYFEKRKRAKDAQIMSQVSREESPSHTEKSDVEKSNDQTSIWQGDMITGRRPDWKEMFAELASKLSGQNVGVLVSGSHTLQQDVARQCRSYTISRSSDIILHYHSVSFEL